MNDLNAYRRSMDALRFTPPQKTRLAREALRRSQAPARTSLRFRRIALLSGMMVLLLSVAAASGLLRTATESFIPIFGSKHAGYIEKTGQSIGVSDTSGGLTVTVDAILGDRYSACIVYTLRRDDNTPVLPRDISPDQLDCSWGGSSTGTGSHGTAFFMDQDPADPAIQFVEMFTADLPLENAAVCAEFGSLCFRDSAPLPHVLIEGSWSLRFDLDYEDTSLILPGGATFTQHDMTFTIEEIRISPISLHLTYSVDRELKWDDASDGLTPDSVSLQMRRYFEQVEILLTTADGTVIDLTHAGGTIRPENGRTYCTKGTLFHTILPPEALVSLEVGGVAYPLSAEK